MTREASVRHPAAPSASITNRTGSKGHVATPPKASSSRRAEVGRGSSVSGLGDGPEPDWVPPQTFDEYRLIRLLGRGSMGSVYLAHDDVLDRPVAVKFIGNIAPDAEDRERFLVEARAVARIQHPNVMVIYRVGELEGHPFLITEYIRGKSLSDLTVPLPWRKVLELAIGLARGLATAHRMGVLHRDIKLANAVLSEDGEVKLLDFSLAKLLDVAVAEPSAPEPEPDVGASTRAAVAAVERHLSEGRNDRNDRNDRNEARPGGRIDRMAETVKVASVLEAAVESQIDGSSAWMRRASLTQAGTLLGTPHYMAPELWRAEPASRRSDVYALGVLLYILSAGRPPTEATSPVELATRVQEQEPRPLLERAPRVDPRLAAIIDRCLRRDPFARFASADDLRSALEQLTPMGRELAIPEGNPYRGLQAFEAQHRALFFGRSAEIRAVVERLRGDALVVVAGDSGAGKSSLCRAGVLPVVEEGGLEPGRSWASAAMTPGRFPVQTLTVALAGLFDMTEETVAALIAGESEALIRALRKQLGDVRGRLLFVDQLEELVTLGEARDVAVVGLVLARLASGIPGLRVLTTVRGDFLTRVAQIPVLGDEIGRAIYLLRQLSPEGAREAIVGPAQTKGVSFETEALVDQLVQSGTGGSLPLLQFALAELWEIRDKASACISAADLTKIGGVTGALARHGDGALAQLLPAQRRAGRRVLMRLVTVDDTRASLTEDELVAGEDAAKAALAALVRARLVVVREVGERVVYEIAHEALLAGWTTLRTWLDEEREARAVRHRLELAVADWERLGRSSDGLWTTAQLVEAGLLEPETLRPREREFLTASRAAVARGRRLRRAALIALPLLAVLVYAGFALQAALAQRARIDAHLQDAENTLAQASEQQAAADALQAEALAHFDRGERDTLAEPTWAKYTALLPKIDREYARAAQALEAALSIDGERADVRGRLGDLLLIRALLAERMGEHAQLADLLARLELYDSSGERRARWNAPAQVSVASSPPGASVLLEEYRPGPDGRRVPMMVKVLGVTPIAALELPAGSYRLSFELPGWAAVRYPFVVGRAESFPVEVELPRVEWVPPGCVYVPAGRSLYGGGIEEMRQLFFHTDPLHQRHTGSFFIAQHETTVGEYIEFLNAQTPENRLRRAPPDTEVGLRQLPDGAWEFSFLQGEERRVARFGEMLALRRPAGQVLVDWTRLPISGLVWDDAVAYLAWLDSSGRVPGARMCSEYEWERAARGADDRSYPHGDHLDASEANISENHDSGAMAPTPVGSYPLSVSPFGLHDTAGNLPEWVSSLGDNQQKVVRSSTFLFDSISAVLLNRTTLGPNDRYPRVGVRVCADYTPRR